MTLAGGQRFNQRELCCCICLHKAASSKGDPGTHGCFCCRVSALLGVMSWDVRLSWACSSSLCLYTALGVLTLQEMAASCGGNTTTARKKNHFSALCWWGLLGGSGVAVCGFWSCPMDSQQSMAAPPGSIWHQKNSPQNSILGKIRFEKAKNVSGEVTRDQVGCWSQVSRCHGHPRGLPFMLQICFQVK